MPDLQDALSILRSRLDLITSADHPQQEIAAIWDAISILANAIERPSSSALPDSVDSAPDRQQDPAER